jgi:regulator of sigma E protease
MPLLQLTALLSVNLAVINLLPIPALDGGHLFFLLIEALRRKPVNQRLQERLTQAGFIFLMGLMVLIVFNDIHNFDIVAKTKKMFGF